MPSPQSRTEITPDRTERRQIYEDPVLLHAIDLWRFIRDAESAELPDELPPVPEAHVHESKRAPNPSDIEISELPRLDGNECREISMSAITTLAHFFGFDAIDDLAMATLVDVLDSHMNEVTSCWAAMEERRRENQESAFNANVSKQVFLNFDVDPESVLEYYDDQIKGTRDHLYERAFEVKRRREEPTDHEAAQEADDEADDEAAHEYSDDDEAESSDYSQFI